MEVQTLISKYHRLVKSTRMRYKLPCLSLAGRIQVILVEAQHCQWPRPSISLLPICFLRLFYPQLLDFLWSHVPYALYRVPVDTNSCLIVPVPKNEYGSFPKKGEPQHRPQYTIILIMATPKMVPLILGNPPYIRNKHSSFEPVKPSKTPLCKPVALGLRKAIQMSTSYPQK